MIIFSKNTALLLVSISLQCIFSFKCNIAVLFHLCLQSDVANSDLLTRSGFITVVSQFVAIDCRLIPIRYRFILLRERSSKSTLT